MRSEEEPTSRMQTLSVWKIKSSSQTFSNTCTTVSTSHAGAGETSWKGYYVIQALNEYVDEVKNSCNGE